MDGALPVTKRRVWHRRYFPETVQTKSCPGSCRDRLQSKYYARNRRLHHCTYEAHARAAWYDISRCSASSGPVFGWIRLSWDLPSRSRRRELSATYFGSATSQFTGAPTWTVVGGPTSSKGEKADCTAMRAYDAAEGVPRHDLDRICKSEARRSRVGSTDRHVQNSAQARDKHDVARF